MTKQLQDAYIVAATRTPVGKAPRGSARNPRGPTRCSRTCCRACSRRCRDRSGARRGRDRRLRDAGGRAGDERRADRPAARRAAEQRRGNDDQPLLLVGSQRGVDRRRPHPHRRGRHHDRRRHREHEHDPDDGAARRSNLEVFARDENLGIAYGMGLTAEKVAERWKVSREDQDAFALASHTKALAAQAGGRIRRRDRRRIAVRESVPDLATRQDRQANSRKLDRDEGPRADTTAEGLAKLRPVFAAKGSVTAGNSSQMSDGAGAVDPREREGDEGARPRAARALGRLSRSAAWRPR